MCGLVGMAGDLNGISDKVMKALLVFDTVRGEDSTGCAFIHKFNDTTAVVKQLGDPFNLFQDGKFESNLKRSNRAIIGHNRYATVGGVSKQNAHPFEFDTLIGAHNGTLSSKFKLPDHQDFKVDSQALYSAIETIGLREAIKPLGAAGNAWSLVWWDKLNATLNFLRNKERPMFMCRSDDGKQLYWASEYWMLDVALARGGIKRGDIFITDEDTHYCVHIDQKGVMHKPTVTIIKPDPVQVVVYQNNGNNNYRKPPHVNLTSANAAKGGTTTTNVVPFHPTTNPVKALPEPGKAGAAAGNPAIVLDKAVVDKAVEKVQQVVKEGGAAKKSIVPVSNDGLASDPSYANAKGRKLEILKAARDGNGQMYLSLFDQAEPHVHIRLYPHRLDEVLFLMEGEDLVGDISGVCEKDKTFPLSYYKVSPWSVKYEGNIVGNDEEEEQVTVMNHRGVLITEKEFNTQYGRCGWCNDNLSILNKNRFTTTGDCLCPDCAKNEEVTRYVNVI